jgi:hypothetical protein
MALLTFSFDTGATPISRIVDAFALQHHYEAFLEDGVTPNPETKAQFAKRVIGRFIKDTVRAAETKAAEDAARDGISDVPLT